MGRAATVTLADDLGPEGDLDTLTLQRLGQLAVCAGFDLVQEAGNGTGLELAVAEDGWSPADQEQEERRTMFWEGVDTMGEHNLTLFFSVGGVTLRLSQNRPVDGNPQPGSA